MRRSSRRHRIRIPISDQTSRNAETDYTQVSEIIEDSERTERSVVAEHPDLQHAAEHLALVLSDHGLQRMTARVLAALLFTEQPSMTMAELAEQLDASSGAISGAIKMLTSVGLAERVPVPSSRRDHFRLRDDAWAVLYTNQNAVISAMQSAAEAASRRPVTTAWRDGASPRCATSMPFSSTRFPLCWTAGINGRHRRRPQ